MEKNLLSVSKFIDDNSCIFEFNSHGFVTKDQNQQMIAKGHRKGNFYALDGGVREALSAVKTKSASSDIWHARLGHPNLPFL